MIQNRLYQQPNYSVKKAFPLEKYKVLRGLEEEGKIKIVGAYYSLKDGSVAFKE